MPTLYYLLSTLGAASDPDLAVVDDPVHGTGFSDYNARIPLGESVAALWPGDAYIRIGKRYGRKLSDLIGTTTHQIFASQRLVALVRAHLQPADQVEILPLSVVDQRGRRLSDAYSVINPLGTVDCLDLEASDIKWYSKDPTQALRVDKAVLNAAKLTEPRSLFRVKQDPMMYILSTPLAEPIRADDTPNVFWKKLEVR